MGVTGPVSQVARDDPGVLSMAAYVFGYFGEDIGTAISLIDRSLELNPSFARGWGSSGWLRLWAGQPDRAIAHFETALRLSPARLRCGASPGDRYSPPRRFDEARATLLRSLQEFPGWIPNTLSRRLLCSDGPARRSARDRAKPAGAHTPRGAERHALAQPQQRELYLAGLRLAAGETT
jgi:hypothetical protein